MYIHDDRPTINFSEEDNFLANTLELRKVTDKLNASRAEMNAGLERLKVAVDCLGREINQFNDKQILKGDLS